MGGAIGRHGHAHSITTMKIANKTRSLFNLRSCARASLQDLIFVILT